MEIYKAVRSYLEENGIRQNFVAARAGFRTNTFNAMMNGHRKMYADDLVAIATALGVTPNEFVRRANGEQSKRGGA